MQKLKIIFLQAIISTKQHAVWWILAFLQVTALVLIGKLARPMALSVNQIWVLTLAFVLLEPITLWLWLSVEAVYTKKPKEVQAKEFIYYFLNASAIVACAIILNLIARLLVPNWIFLTIVSSLVAATTMLALLYSILCRQPFGRAWHLALYTWKKKTSLAAEICLILLICHGVSFALVHNARLSVHYASQFSDLSHSATIWTLLAVISGVVAFFAAVINYFVVAVFLDIINRQKDPEQEKTAEKVQVLEVHG